MEGAKGGSRTYPRTVEEIFEDFKGRQAGLVRALSEDEEDLFVQCDPNQGCLCLYTFPDGTWKVSPPETWEGSVLPKPEVGINIWRDEKPREEWLRCVASDCGPWLFVVAIRFATLSGLDNGKIRELFCMFRTIPTTRDALAKANPRVFQISRHWQARPF